MTMDRTIRRSASQPVATLPQATAAEAAAPAQLGLVNRLHSAVNVVYREMVKFGTIGALAYLVDTYVYNLLRTGIWPVEEAPLAHKPLLSKVVSVAVATVVAWLGNRYWTFRHRRRATIRAEFVLFVVMNVGGLAIALGCLWFSHYVLDLTSALADNISGNVVGLVLGTLFRFWAYRQFVFTELRGPATAEPVELVTDEPVTEAGRPRPQGAQTQTGQQRSMWMRAVCPSRTRRGPRLRPVHRVRAGRPSFPSGGDLGDPLRRYAEQGCRVGADGQAPTLDVPRQFLGQPEQGRLRPARRPRSHRSSAAFASSSSSPVR